MEMLDPARHSPKELEGKGLVIAGCPYVVGALFRESEQGFAHHLTNLRSGLSLYIVQLRYCYQVDPADATAKSKVKADLTRELRTGIMKRGDDLIVDPIRTIQIGDIAVELHEFQHGDMRIPADALDYGKSLRWPDVVASLNPAVDSQPNNTQVLALRARAHQQIGNCTFAVRDIAAARAIEPNLSRYRLEQIEYALHSGNLADAQTYLDQFKLDFPGERDADSFEFHIAIRQGRWDAAELVLREGALPSSEVERLGKSLVDVRRAARTLRFRSWWSKIRSR
ncbi:tetratricopeptide repeat protein [Rhizobacter fulvus]